MDAVNQLHKANPGFLDNIGNRQQTTAAVTNTPIATEEIQRLWNHFKRYVDLNDRRVKALEVELAEKTEILKGLQGNVSKSNEKQTIEASREKMFQMQNATKSRPPSTVPIDRTGVAPSLIQLDKIFYTGRGR